jgi:hypothetical protein
MFLTCATHRCRIVACAELMLDANKEGQRAYIKNRLASSTLAPVEPLALPFWTRVLLEWRHAIRPLP